ncbi:hypothetical protein [Pseudoxanthomonas sacheonensis]|uniref:hypothetical protein n=1 Tax=Pseudoxanthomonas sacheonensis TaxID=443615 RepID=UPI0013D035E0|nr:hypothetical protein [Pseudoxanthomonas sacheonensis]
MSAALLLILLLLLPEKPRESRQAGQANPAGAAHTDVRRFWSSRMLLPKIPAALADPAASSLGATLGRLSFGYFSLPFKEK